MYLLFAFLRALLIWIRIEHFKCSISRIWGLNIVLLLLYWILLEDVFVGIVATASSSPVKVISSFWHNTSAPDSFFLVQCPYVGKVEAKQCLTLLVCWLHGWGQERIFRLNWSTDYAVSVKCSCWWPAKIALCSWQGQRCIIFPRLRVIFSLWVAC